MAKKYYESKTPAWQRWAIWIIAIAMVGGTVLTYVVIFIANNNTNANPTQIAYNKYLDEQQKKQDELAAQQQAVIDKYVAFDDAYADQVGAFDATAVKN